MNELEQLNDFSAILESIEMPEHLAAALMEAFTYTHHDFVIPPDQPLPPEIETEIKRRLAKIEQKNKAWGIPFDPVEARRKLENQARKFPQSFSMTTDAAKEGRERYEQYLDKSVGMNMRNSSISVPNPHEARNNYYKAAMDVVARTYQKYGIPFDEQKNLDYVMRHDRDSDHREFDRTTAQNLSFPTFDVANTNQILNKLKLENSALRTVLQKCYWFLVNLQKAQEEGSVGGYLMVQKMKYSTDAVPEEAKPVAKLTEEDQADFDRKEAERIAKENAPKGYQPVASRVSCIGELRNVFSRLPYYKLYQRFAQSANPQQLEMTPRPNEKFFQFLWRVNRGSTPVGAFVDHLAKDMKAAYPEMDWNRTLEYYMDKVKDFRDFSMLSQRDTENALNQGLISQDNAALYKIWATFQYIKQAKEELGR